jgi:hypothetical protein
MRARKAFGPGLRSARERAGVTLEAIAESTKINRALLVELENNDLSHWPPGIFRRAFFREYLAAIGIASESLVAEFIRLFPDEGAAIPEATPAEGGSEMRLTLAETPGAGGRAAVRHVAAALADLCLVVLLSGAVVRLAGVELWSGTAVVALIYYGFATACTGRTPAVFWLTGTRQVRTRVAPVSLSTVGESLRIVARPGDLRVPQPAQALSDERPQRLRAVSG